MVADLGVVVVREEDEEEEDVGGEGVRCVLLPTGSV
jgi:hypothetical protein